jgi:integrase
MTENDFIADVKAKKRARRGSGSVYQPKYQRAGKTELGSWRVRYHWRGKLYDLAIPVGRKQSKREAQNYLSECIAEHVKGTAVEAGTIHYQNLRDGLLRHYAATEKRSLKTAKDGKTHYITGLKHLDEFFLPWNPLAMDIKAAEIKRFIGKRDAAGDKAANISVSVRLLRRMFYIAIEEDEVLSVAHKPNFTVPKEPPPRKGFLEPYEFERLYAALPDDLRPVARLAYTTAMRCGEVCNLEWERVDLTGRGEIRLTAEDTKTGEGRTVPLLHMLPILRIMRAKHPKDQFVFGGDKPLGDFRKRWHTACVKAGVGKFVCRECENDAFDAEERCTKCKGTEQKYQGRTFHDMRRSAVRNFVRAGVSEKVAMSISGHKTRSVFDRYNITATNDLHDAMKRLDEYVLRLEKTSAEQTASATSDADTEGLVTQ